MAKTSSVTGKIFVGLFMVVLFPTGALLLQSYLGAKSGSEEKEEGQKQNQTQNLVVNVHNHPPASSLLSPPTTPPPPAKSKGDAPKTSGEEPDRGAQRPSPSPEMSYDLSGTWKGTWDNSEGHGGEGVLTIKEQLDKTIVGWWDKDFKIEKGRRISKSQIRWESHLDRSYQVEATIENRGRTLVLVYFATYQDDSITKSYVGSYRLARDGAKPFSEAQPVGFSGKWCGKYSNSMGYAGDDDVMLKETQDGSISGTWGTMPIRKGVKVNARIANFEATSENRHYKVKAERIGYTLRLNYTVTGMPANKEEEYSGVAWLVRQGNN